MSSKVQILMATYNGEPYLRQQLDSILAQSFTDWEILVRDDGSKDATMEILEEFARNHPGRMRIIHDDTGNLGCCRNFERLMEHATSDIIAFADQDDIWYPEKIARSVQAIEAMEEKHGVNVPALVHHDYAVIDANGEQTSPSFEQKNNTGKANGSLNHMLVQCIVYGFSSTVNRALVQKALPFPETLDMHDTHVGLVATTFGNIEYMPDQLANYRIHGKNVAGGNNAFYNFSLNDLSLRNIFNGHSYRCLTNLFNVAHEKLKEKCGYAAAFLDRYGDEIPADKKALFEDFARLADSGALQRKQLIIKNGFFPNSTKMAGAFLALG